VALLAIFFSDRLYVHFSCIEKRREPVAPLNFLPCERSVEEITLSHSRFQLDGLSVDDEFAVSGVVKGLAILLCWIDPSLQYCKNEDVVFVHKTRVGYFAFEVGKAFFDERGRYRCGWYFGQSEGREFVGTAAA